jgi:hypothetical protein
MYRNDSGIGNATAYKISALLPKFLAGTGDPSTTSQPSLCLPEGFAGTSRNDDVAAHVCQALWNDAIDLVAAPLLQGLRESLHEPATWTKYSVQGMSFACWHLSPALS